MPASIFAKTFDTTGSLYGPTSGPSYYSSDLSAHSAKTVGAALVSTPSAPSSPVNALDVFPLLSASPFGTPVGGFVLVLLAVIGVYTVWHKYGKTAESDLGTPRIGLGSFLSIGFQAALFLFAMKTVLTKYHIAGVSEFFGAI